MSRLGHTVLPPKPFASPTYNVQYNSYIYGSRIDRWPELGTASIILLTYIFRSGLDVRDTITTSATP